ncbi:amylo-alpha-1,6-glucosidase [Deinococcus alpinitundrae]|uniref:amylo-alpha-1,6-glucosidase n=1 Tax=Deinococcus alpinitundrae TaxID=468913 RepID=UPI00137A2147|nr:amylo-alpha-1,6-glucosidase [Deinococcus alpinitundrae]
MAEPVPRSTHRLGPQAARDLTREVLLPDGLGGFALSSPAGVPTRCYSGLSVSHRPPGERRVMFVTATECLQVGPQRCDLHAFEVAPGTLEGQGLSVLSGVTLRDLLPEREQMALGMSIRRRSVVPRHSGALVLLYEIDAPHLKAGQRATLTLGGVLVDRDMHRVHLQTPELSFECLEREVRVRGESHQARLRLHAGDMAMTSLAPRPLPQRLHFRLDTARGAPDTERAVRADFWEIELRPGLNQLALVVEGLATRIDDPWAAYATEAARRAGLVDQAWQASGVPDDVVATLAVAADAFMVRRASTDSLSVIAGYPWFADWGRDSLIALPGLLLSTGRIEEGLGVIDTFAASLRGGLTPNNFFDDGQGAGYNTVDGALWLIVSLEKLVRRAASANLTRVALGIVRTVVGEYARGTGYGIALDPADGLLRAGLPGTQLTWMDVKIHDWVVTPRHGKAVEIQALWLSALGAELRLSRSLGEVAEFGEVLALARTSFSAFWNPENGYLFDVLDADSGAQVRPNALIALALPDTPADPSQVDAALDVAARELLTPLGLRTLSPLDAAYLANYGGDQLVRDAAYHQGTVWPWLMGAYTDLLLSRGRVAEARAALGGLRGHLWEAGLGSVSEVISPADLTPGGCSFQAWSVAELLRAHIAVSRAERALSAPRGLSMLDAPPVADSPGVGLASPGQISANLGRTSPVSPGPASLLAAATPRRSVRIGSARSLSLPPDGMIGGSNLGPSGLSAGLLGLVGLPGMLPEVQGLSLAAPEPMDPGPVERTPGPTTASAGEDRATPREPQAPVPADSPVHDELIMPALTDFDLPAPTPSPPLTPTPALSVEDPDVIEPLT